MIRRVFNSFRGKGQIELGLLVGLVLLTLVVLSILPAINSGTLSGAISTLEGGGYAVISASEYSVIVAKLDAIAAAATAANNAAVIAAAAAQTTLTKLELHTENENFLFPDTTYVSVTLSAPAVANTWKAWTEIVGNDTVTFSSKFAANGGYISQVTAYEYSVADKLIIIEIAYDDDDTDVVGRAMMRSDFTWVLELNSEPIPAGSTIYYRMMSNQANESIKANFKYFYD